MFVPRDLSAHVQSLMQWFPVVSVTGPRQSGKSTLLKEMFPDFTYVNLEEPGLKDLVTADPLGFLRSFDGPLIIDEAQHSADLFSAVQLVSDEKGTPGQFILSGSQNFLLLAKISQSLAGRVGISHLLPFGFSELRALKPETTATDFALTGGYPRLHNLAIPADVFFENYTHTYVERDVRDLLRVQNLAAFRKFIALCAHQAGSLVNYTKLASELDVSFATVKNWVSVLESSFLILTLPPFHANTRKTVTKTPKLFFYDTGLLCFLLGIRSTADLATSPHVGAVIENLVVSEAAKAHLHAGHTPELFFYRDDSKREIDLIDSTSNNGNPTAFEIKASHTYNKKYGRHLATVGEELGIPAEARHVLYRGNHALQTPEYRVTPMESYLEDIGTLEA